MDMVGHQAPCPDLHSGRATRRCEQIAIDRIIVIVEECSRPAVATLRHVVRQARNDDTSKTGHAPQRFSALSPYFPEK
jgi:hypothetical protein